VIDLSAGTGDMTLALLQDKEFTGRVIMVDFNSDMLALADSKLQWLGLQDRVALVLADVEHLPFRDELFDGAMQGFALRNLESLERFFRETARILKRDKPACFLEIAHPKNRVFGKLFYIYFYNLLPRLTTVISGDGTAYRWLPQSLKEFPFQKEVVRKMKESGIREALYTNLAGGVVACYQGKK
jgi:demethylmenaquinone methyltransferase/2-methoxy-6-polyprenyl-1,4-benzoquinol methylase